MASTEEQQTNLTRDVFQLKIEVLAAKLDEEVVVTDDIHRTQLLRYLFNFTKYLRIISGLAN